MLSNRLSSRLSIERSPIRNSNGGNDGITAVSESPIMLNRNSTMISRPQQQQDNEYSEKTYDGYQDIIEANASVSRDDELAAMREARRRNRIGQEAISDSDL